jgi:hypothetical protein
VGKRVDLKERWTGSIIKSNVVWVPANLYKDYYIHALIGNEIIHGAKNLM